VTLRILVTGGGTGGHVAPALAIIEELRRRHGAAVTIGYVGSASGLEARAVPQADPSVQFVGVSSGKLRRSSKGIRGLLTVANVRDALRVPVGVLQSLRAVRSFQPDVVVATGGYVAVPPVIAAGLLRRPVVVHEQTVTFGLANRISGRFATKIALSFDGSLDMVPPKQRGKTVVTGNPVRKEVLSGDSQRAYDTFGVAVEDRDHPTVFVTGGAQGSRKVNYAIRDALSELTMVAVVIHQCGSADLAELMKHRDGLAPMGRQRWIVREFLSASDVGDAYALADVVVARSGAGTVTEICALGKPTVFIPLEPTSHDEQTRNAQRVVDAGGAVIVKQADCSAATVLGAIRPILSDSPRRVAMSTGAQSLARPGAVLALADLIESVAKQRRGRSPS
jgi:UDP-N-acetylglucosamine--N-acetylmuramyl-(pentapeptide) pyrophosphoryl-undecaprenol N-acetylglucosamine transferase